MITAIASIRAKDGMTPTPVLQFLETILKAVDIDMDSNLVTPDEEVLMERKRRKANKQTMEEDEESDSEIEILLPLQCHMLPVC